jgi:transglutaminase-like putative cysteine protease
VRASSARRSSELKQDRISVEHLVTGGRLIFTPYFANNVASKDYNIKTVADLNTEVTNSLFRRPQYVIDFYSVDNVLDRLSGNAIEDMRDYFRRYDNLFEDLSFWSPEQIESRFPGAFVLSYNEAMDFTNVNRADFNENYTLTLNFYNNDGGSDINNDISVASSYSYAFIPKEYDSEVAELQKDSQFWYNEVLPADFVLSEMAYNNFVRKHYLQLPPELPEEVINLARELTQGLESDYDKALVLEYYLAKTYEYTLNPRAPYDNAQDFVYNFLFDVKEGYCSYYATAMTVMLRSLGIPAREVEGYIIDTRRITRDEHGNPVSIVVLDSNAHAWTEVYLRGIGWIPFEPTAAYYQEPEELEVPLYEYVPPVRPLYIAETTTVPYEEEEWEDDTAAAAGADNIDYTNLYKALFVLFSVIFIISGFYFINYGINNQRFKYFKNANANSATIKMLSYTLKFLKLCGFVIRSDEGLVAFAKRISHNFPMLKSDGWVNIMRIMQKARYSVHQISEKEREYVCGFLSDLREECLKNLKFGLKFRLRFVKFVI